MSVRRDADTQLTRRGGVTRRELINTILMIIYIYILVMTIRYIKPSLVQLAVMLCIISVVWSLVRAIRARQKPNPFRMLFGCVITAGVLYIAVILIRYLGVVWGVVVFTILMGAYIIVTQWQQYIASVVRLETAIWGDRKNVNRNHRDEGRGSEVHPGASVSNKKEIPETARDEDIRADI